MNPKAERLATYVREIRGSQSQRQFAKRLGVSQSSVNLWESGQSWPETENLEKLAAFKGWSLQDFQTYLVEGKLPSSDPLDQVLRILRSLPTEAVAKVATEAVETLAARTGSML
jgi:transcriptional regulator with XRE-family HTH domain